MPQNMPSFCLCRGPNWVPAQTMSLLTISQHAQLSLVFRNLDWGDEVAGRSGVRMWWSKSGASNWELLTNLLIQTQFRNWGYLQLHQYRLVLKWSSQSGSTENVPEKTEHNSFHDNHLCLQKTPHISEKYSIQICGCRGTTVILTHKWTLGAGQEGGSGHSFIALSCPTKYLLGEVPLLLTPPSDLQVTCHSVWLTGCHDKVSRMDTSWICLRNTLFRDANDFHQP